MNKKPDSLFKFKEKDSVGGPLQNFYALLNNFWGQNMKGEFRSIETMWKTNWRYVEWSGWHSWKSKTVSFKLKLIQLEILY